MPFADHGRLIPALLHQFGEGYLGAIELQTVVEDAVQMGVLSSLDHGARGRANGVCTKGVCENHALVGQTVDMGRLVDARAVGAYGLEGMVIRKYKDDVRGLGLSLWAASPSGGYQKYQGKDGSELHNSSPESEERRSPKGLRRPLDLNVYD
jgi:hypothetical protein